MTRLEAAFDIGKIDDYVKYLENFVKEQIEYAGDFSRQELRNQGSRITVLILDNKDTFYEILELRKKGVIDDNTLEFQKILKSIFMCNDDDYNEKKALNSLKSSLNLFGKRTINRLKKEYELIGFVFDQEDKNVEDKKVLILDQEINKTESNVIEGSKTNIINSIKGIGDLLYAIDSNYGGEDISLAQTMYNKRKKIYESVVRNNYAILEDFFNTRDVFNEIIALSQRRCPNPKTFYDCYANLLLLPTKTLENRISPFKESETERSKLSIAYLNTGHKDFLLKNGRKDVNLKDDFFDDNSNNDKGQHISLDNGVEKALVDLRINYQGTRHSLLRLLLERNGGVNVNNLVTNYNILQGVFGNKDVFNGIFSLENSDEYDVGEYYKAFADSLSQEPETIISYVEESNESGLRLNQMSLGDFRTLFG